MKIMHFFMAVIIALLWGANFVAIKLSLEIIPPFTQLALRFFLICFPLIFFVARPQGEWAFVFKFSFFLWVFQLTFINLSLKYGVPPGMCSLLMQMKVIVVLLLSKFFYKYHLNSYEIIGIFISFFGLILMTHDIGSSTANMAYLYIIPAVLSVSGAALLFKKKNNPIPPFSLIVWAALIAFIPMACLSLIFEDISGFFTSLEKMNHISIGAVLYSVIFATFIATSWYVYLMRIYGPEKIVPFNLLIPIFGFIISAYIYDEKYNFIQMMAIVLILGGLALNQLGGQWKKKNKRYTIHKFLPSSPSDR